MAAPKRRTLLEPSSRSLWKLRGGGLVKMTSNVLHSFQNKTPQLSKRFAFLVRIFAFYFAPQSFACYLAP